MTKMKMSEDNVYELVGKLCIACGMSIDRISRKCGHKQDEVAMLFMKKMELILRNMKR